MPSRRFVLPSLILLAGLTILLSFRTVYAQGSDPTPTEPNTQGDTAALAAQMDAVIPPLLERYHIPGAAVAVIEDGQTTWSQGYGLADVEANIAATADTPFAVWSLSKSLTAAAILRLVEEGRLDLDAPISTYVTNWQIPRTRQPVDLVTARRILTHTAGLSVDGYAGYTVEDAANGAVPSLVDLLNGAGDADPVGVLIRPGLLFMYSGGGYTILQLAIEEITGQSFADYIQQTILDPLGMTHTSFTYNPDLGAAINYMRDGSPDPRVIHVAQAAGGLVSSANDLATYYAALMDGRVISAEDVTQMFAIDPVAEDYGFGVYSAEAGDGTQVVFHDGIGPSAQSLFVLFPERREGIVIVTNGGAGRAIYAETLCVFNAYAITDAPELCIWHE